MLEIIAISGQPSMEIKLNPRESGEIAGKSSAEFEGLIEKCFGVSNRPNGAHGAFFTFHGRHPEGLTETTAREALTA